ncbi:shikimate dehydrogenase [Synechococcus sp. CCY9201]|uniref:shikimate dehydrogenase n=1 Tax=unclassified Synechococcus TaxID=2626047 RepID=UPI002AD1F31B|nr:MULTISPECIES: shikimate dehydrogenase [unclassified Synechococcus]MEA5473770.1 shikimate dehydrogenase [Synechococcus sp. CCY9201]CAK6686713.1 Shikimate dehydrogenase (NADP(+)) [Synechococcus sp. CBW1107]
MASISRFAQPISGSTALVGVLGDPVRHSLSPVMHNAALKELGLDWVYLALPTPAEHLGEVVRGLEAMDCRGLNVTLPHKQAVAGLASELSDLAQRVGAVNTLVRQPGGGWLGTNTDVEGFLAPLRQDGADIWRGRRAVVLGCGGSARAVVAALVELGLERIDLLARRPEALTSFVATCLGWAPQLQPLAWASGAGIDGGSGVDGAAALEALEAADVVVNTTPIGMASAAAGATELSPLSAAELEVLRPGATVYDLIYTPRPTRLLQQATARGCRTLDGLEMLVQQGAAALRLWSGHETVPVEAMREAALTHLAGRCP